MNDLNGKDKTLLEMVGEADHLTRRLDDILQELRERNPHVAHEIVEDILRKLSKHLVNDSAQNGEEMVPIASGSAGPPTQPYQVAITNKDGVASFFRSTDISQRERSHRNLKAAAVEDAILGLLFANEGRNHPITYQDISEELRTLDLKEDRNTTYGRVSRLRKEGLIAEVDPENKSVYSLTEKGHGYTSNMLAKRGLLKPAG